MKNKKEKYQQFCIDLTEKYLKELSGEGKNSEYIFNSSPSEKILVGILDSGISNEESSRYTSMPMIKVQFFTNLDKVGDLKVDISGNFYYNVVPTFEEELNFVNEEKEKINKRKYVDEDVKESDTDKKDANSIDIVQFVSKYKKISVKSIWSGLLFSKKELIENEIIDFSDELNRRLYDGFSFDDSVYYNDKEIVIDAISSKEKYEHYISTHSGDSDSQIVKAKPRWKFSGQITCKKSLKNEKYIITLIVENVTEKSSSYIAKEFENKKYSIPLYNAQVQIEAMNGLKFESIELENFENSYKVDSKVKAKGEWLSAECFDNKIVTKNVPRYIEKRLIAQDKFDKNLYFKSLQTEPIKNLREILDGMNDYYDEISKRDIKDEKYLLDLKKIRYEITRFEKGIEILEDLDFIAAKKAFICMNKVFEKILTQKSNCWRLFQIVFIVSMISDIVYSENKYILESEIYNYRDSNIAEILYFPTGGGKTEAFLGTVILSCFYDRFIGKKYGVNTIIKYPLRLLSIQQLERTLKAIIVANQVLKEEQEIKDLPIFSLGYFVGSSNTPNSINEEEVIKYEHNKDYVFVEKCTSCGGEIDVVYNYDTKVLEHKCKECNEVLPLYIVDDEIYRFLPSVLISTVDKFAAVSLKDEFRNILGGSKYRCPIHGFSYNRKCNCNINDKVYNIYDTQKQSLVPSLFIQDEIHLLKESLGVFSAHYESFLDYYMSSLIEEKYRKKVKYIGATATISGAEYLVKELYGKECRIFPAPSVYENNETFYSKISENEISRIIIGFAPFGDAINSRIEYAVSIYRLILFEMYNNPHEYADIYEMTEKEFREMLSYYWTSIVYFRSKNDNNKLRNTFEQQANNGRMKEIPDACFDIARMTGDEEFFQIKKTLNDMQIERDKMKTHNLVLATSTISHGVDSKDFNNIFFYGIPSNTAEYIQSYSRVGRSYTGIVIDIIRLSRNRDISFLKYFNLMHKYKDYLIDENRLNSKSSIAMYHTFPGIVISLLKHYYAIRDNKKYETLGEVKSFFWNDDGENSRNYSDIFSKLCKIYRCEDVVDENSIDAQFKKNIKRELVIMAQNLPDILKERMGVNYSFSSNIGEITSHKFKNMISLRDVDKNYDIGIELGDENNEKE
ncbi:MAG: hypothetical protein IJ809_02545 [Clostridia bacterium]|nr:hypothetical protein [Clostridia bacterium]